LDDGEYHLARPGGEMELALSGTPASTRVVDYEAELNRVIPNLAQVPGPPLQRMDHMLRIVEFFERYSKNDRPAPVEAK